MIPVVYFGERKTGQDCLSILRDHPNFKIVGVCSHSLEPCFKNVSLPFPFIFHNKEAKSKMFEQVCSWRPKAILSVDNSFIFAGHFLELVEGRAFNLHFGNLPRNAGWMSYVGAILNGEIEYGITIHRIVQQVDSGPVFMQKNFALQVGDTSFSVFRKSHKVAQMLFKKFLDSWADEKLDERPQDLSRRTVYIRKDFQNLSIDFNLEIEKIRNLLRANDFGMLKNPLPPVWVLIGGRKFRLDELKLDIIDKSDKAINLPGTIIKINDEGADIQCRGGTVRVFSIKGLPAKDILQVNSN